MPTDRRGRISLAIYYMHSTYVSSRFSSNSETELLENHEEIMSSR